VPVERLRTKLREIVEASPLWDGKVCVVQVTDLKEHTVEVRALVSAADAGAAFDLRCEVRERMVAFIRDEYPDALPRLRASLDSPTLEHGRRDAGQTTNGSATQAPSQSATALTSGNP